MFVRRSGTIGRRVSARASLQLVLCASVALAASPAALGQSVFATHVVDYSPGPYAGPPFDDPLAALDGPQGGGLTAGTLDVVTLGVGGSLTLGFDVVITNGRGADFTVFENAFAVQSESNTIVFSEVAFVEVSSNGVDFARFRVDYEGSPSTPPTYWGTPWGAYEGMCGNVPTAANVLTNGIDPTNPVVSGGEAFDLEDLAGHPLVLAKKLNLLRVKFVRIVDCKSGQWLDAEGEVIYDNGGITGSVDIDAVAVINHTQNVSFDQPEVDLHIDALGYIRLSLSDPNGLWDLDPTWLQVSYNLNVISIENLLLFGVFKIESLGPLGIEFVTPFTVQDVGTTGVLAASIRDWQQHRSSDQISIQP